MENGFFDDMYEKGMDFLVNNIRNTDMISCFLLSFVFVFVLCVLCLRLDFVVVLFTIFVLVVAI